MTVTPRRWERNGATLTLQHLPRRKSVALQNGPYIGSEVLAWLTDADADDLAAILDVMLPPAGYGDGSYGA